VQSGRPWRVLAAVWSLLAAPLFALGVFPSVAAAYPYAEVTLLGHGWGPGIGMGQWGALGYALGGWTYQQILTHFYGETASGPTRLASLSNGQEDTDVRVVMVEDDGRFTTVTSDSPFSVAGVAFKAGQAAQIVPAAEAGAGSSSVPSSGSSSTSAATSGGYDVFEGPSCAGPWSSKPVASGVATPEAVPATDPPLGSSHAASQVLQLCLQGGNLYLRGDIEETTNAAGELRTLNVLPLEDYVAGVVPNESPASWGSLGPAGPQGEPWGFQELEAQAVAARSYVMSDLGGWGGYADICDTTCQSYRGIGNETPLSDAAVLDTAGVVVEMPSGAIATTYYSSSTGGWTAPGIFAPVVDAGDSVCVPGACNPHHTWQAQVSVSSIEQVYPSVGTLVSLQVLKRNGLGDFGGRVLELEVVGTRASVTVSGDAFATTFGLQSNWFSVASQPSGGVTGYWLAGSHGGVFSFGDAKFYGSMGGKHLDAPIVGMAATPSGGGYWLVAADGGVFSFGDAKFYGSMGGKHLDAPIVGMAATPSGGGYWEVGSDGGVFTFGDASYEGSLPAMGATAHVVSFLPTATGEGYLFVTEGGRAIELGDAPQLGQVVGSVAAWDGSLVGGAMVLG